MFVGTNDTLGTVKDNRENKEKLKSLVHYKEVYTDHLSFVLGKNMTYFQEVIQILDQYTKPENKIELLN